MCWCSIVVVNSSASTLKKLSELLENLKATSIPIIRLNKWMDIIGNQQPSPKTDGKVQRLDSYIYGPRVLRFRQI